MDTGPFVESAEVKQVQGYETEQALIGAVMRGGRLVYEKVRDIVKTEMLWSHAHQNIWSAFDRLYENGMQIDQIIVGDEIERAQKMGELEQELGNGVWSGRMLLTKLRDTGEPRNAVSYAENIQDVATNRKILEAMNQGAVWALNGRRPKDILSDLNTELGKFALYSQSDEYTVPISVAVSEAYDWTEAASNGQIVGVPTGFIDLDAILGSLYPKNVYIVAARPGQGKTAFLLSIALHAAQKNKKRVCIFSLEMAREQVAQRLIAQYAEVDLSNITRGKMQDGEWPKYTHGVEVIGGLSEQIIINDLSSININQIRQVARKVQADGGLDLIVLDYIQLTESGNKKNERRELDVSEVSRGLKYLARELEVPVLAAAQLSREVEKRSDKRPILSDLRESGSLEQDAYSVMFIYRPDQYEKDTSRQNVAEIIVAKHRNGPVGSCELVYRGPFTKFENAMTMRFTK